MSGEPWLDYAAPEGEAAPWQDFGGEAAPAEPAKPFDYSGHVSALIKAGADKKEIEDYVRGVGADPSQIGNLDAALKARSINPRADIRVVMQPAGDSAAQIDRTPAEGFGMGVRGVMTGAGGLLDMAAGPVNGFINALPGEQGLSTTPFRDAADAGADWLGLAKPFSEGERLTNAAVEGGAGGLASAGLGGAVAGASGAVGAVGRALASAPGIDLVSGAASGASGDAARQLGGGPVTQFIASILGGVGGGVGAMGASRAFSRMTPKIAAVIDRTPPEAVLTESGALNEHGRELAQRSGVPDEVMAESFARARTGTGPRPRASSQAGREAARSRERAPIETRPQDMEPQPNTAPPPDLEGANTRLVEGIEGRLERPRSPFPDSPERTDSAFGEARSENVPLTRGQAERDFGVQNDEQSLFVAASKEGNLARQFRDEQNQSITDAVERFRRHFGDTDATPAERGETVKNAISDLRDQGREGVNAMYRLAEDAGGETLPLNTERLHEAATDILIDEAVPEAVKKAVSQEMARYGLIGEAAPTNEAGITRVTLDDGSSVSFRGQPKQLTVANAEDFRKRINSLYDSDPTKISQGLKGHIDDAVEAALEQAASGDAGNVSQAYQAARFAHRNQRNTFHSKDIIQNIIDVRKGTKNTPLVMPERVISQVLGNGSGAVTNIRKVKGLLLSGGTVGSKQAWRGIQAQTLADIFGSATNTQTQTISGARLNTAIRKFGVDRLREVLDQPEFNQLMKLQRIIGDATIPMSGTTNPSGTFTKLVNFMGKGALRLGGIGEIATSLASKARNLAVTRRTLEGITNYDGVNGADMDRRAREFVQEYIRAAGSGSIITAGLNASRPKEQ